MSSSSDDGRHSRSEATSRVTSALVCWLWDQGARIIVPEVGLTATGQLRPPWGQRWRVDVVAVVGSRVWLMEVKGTKADLVREDYASGKWVLPLSPNLRPWLVVDSKITQDPLPAWGLMSVANDKLTVVRKSPDDGVARTDDDGVFRTLAQILTLQSLPTMMGRDRAHRMLALTGFDRPWRRYFGE